VTAYEDALRSFKRGYFIKALRLTRGNQCKAAELIGVHRNTMNRLLRECGLTNQDIRAAIASLKPQPVTKTARSTDADRINAA
jgi:Fis family transcriptional regulator